MRLSLRPTAKSGILKLPKSPTPQGIGPPCGIRNVMNVTLYVRAIAFGVD